MSRNVCGGWRAQDGQVMSLLAGLLVLVGLATFALAHLGAVAADRARAQTAADGAALAGAAEGRRSAEHLLAVNGAKLVAYRVVDSDVVVTAAVRGARATARAHPEVSGDRRAGDLGIVPYTPRCVARRPRSHPAGASGSRRRGTSSHRPFC